MNPARVFMIGNAGGSSGGGGGGGGGGGTGVDIFNTSATRITIGTATATYKLAASGTGTSSGQSSWSWLLSGLNSDYQVYASVSSGSTPAGTLNSWVALSSDRSWSVTSESDIDVTCVLNVQIRRAVDSVVIDTATVNFEALSTGSGGGGP